MNDHSPRRFKGSLLERAAEQFRFDVNALPPVAPAEPRRPAASPTTARETPPPPAPEPVVVRQPEPVAEPEPAVVPEPIARAPEAASEPVATAEPEVAYQPEAETPEPTETEIVESMPPEPATPPLSGAPVPHDAGDPWEHAIFELTEIEEPAPVRAIETPRRHAGRRFAPIDRSLLADQGMLAPGGPVTALAEEFRMVKRQLLLTARAVAGADADRARMILVCSANPNEGKTFCAINLALSMAAEKDMEILLVDADLAKPDVMERLGVPAGPGLLDALSGTVEHVEDCIVDTDIPQLALLPAGTRSHSDTELLASDRARAIFDGLAAANPRRIVIFDSPPALAASMASVLALHVGQVMLVVRADKTSESDLREATTTLDACEHIQLVLNGVSFQPGGRRLGSYYEESAK